MVSDEMKDRNRAEYCSSTEACDGICIAMRMGMQGNVKCEYFIASTYKWMDIDFDATGLPVRMQPKLR